MTFKYPCPACGSENQVHRDRCRHANVDIRTVRKAYVDIISILSTRPHTPQNLKEECHGPWDSLHSDVLDKLQRTQRVQSVDPVDVDLPFPDDADVDGANQPTSAVADGGTATANGRFGTPQYNPQKVLKDAVRNDTVFLELLTPDEWREQRTPEAGHIETIWQQGAVDGALDNSIFALIAWHADQDFTWEGTKERMLNWMDETNTWKRGSFAENRPEQVIENKEHVHDGGYGFSSKAEAAAHVIEDSTNTN